MVSTLAYAYTNVAIMFDKRGAIFLAYLDASNYNLLIKILDDSSLVQTYLICDSGP